MLALGDWDLETYRERLRRRGLQLKRDPKVRVRFDESDLANETLLRAIQAKDIPADSTNDAQRLAWLQAIQDHIVIDKLRQNYADKRDVRREQDLRALRQALSASSLADPGFAVAREESPSEALERRETEQALDAALAQLPADQSNIVRLRRQGYTFDEIATELRLSLGQTTNRYYKGIERLRELLPSEDEL